MASSTGPMAGAARRLMLLGALAMAMLALLAIGSERAEALCGGPPAEAGLWRNADPSARGIAQIELRDCQPITTCSGGVCSTSHDAGWAMRVWGKCHPTDCDWGSVSARRLSSGQIFGYYDQGFARRYVYARMSGNRPGQLWVHWRTDFVDPAREDYSMHEWFVRGH